MITFDTIDAGKDFDSYYLQRVVAAFMILFGVNLYVYRMIPIGEVSQVLGNEELRVYLGIMFISVLMTIVNISPLYGNAFKTFHYAYFQVSSIMTAMGFATGNFDVWPTFSSCCSLC